MIYILISMHDFSEFNMKYDGAGHPTYHPGILLKLLLEISNKIRE